MQRISILKEKVCGCEICEIRQKTSNVVFGEGNPETDIILIGEAAGYHEQRTGIPFVGEAGKQLNEILVTAGIKRNELYITNIVKCRPVDGMSNRKPHDYEVKNCINYLLEEIEIISPKLIVTAGLVPFKNLSTVPKKIGTVTIRKLQKENPFKFSYNKTIPIIYTYHPSYVMRKIRAKKDRSSFNESVDDWIWIMEYIRTLNKKSQLINDTLI